MIFLLILKIVLDRAVRLNEDFRLINLLLQLMSLDKDLFVVTPKEVALLNLNILKPSDLIGLPFLVVFFTPK